MSHGATCQLITTLGEGHDKLVKEWRDQFSLSLKEVLVDECKLNGYHT